MPFIGRLVSVLKTLAPPILWLTLKKIRLHYKKYHGQWQIDKIIETYVDYDDGYYVELGAVDGIGLSNTLYFELKRNWAGLLIEPSPNNYFKCLENRSSKNAIICAACTSFEYSQKFVEMVYSHYMTTPVGLDTDITDPASHAQSGALYLGSEKERIFTFGALARPLSDILQEVNAPKIIDFLSLDVEGAELEVLKGVDHDIFQFKVICVESRNIQRVQDYLEPLGYEYQRQISPHDFIFTLKAAGS
jgi:FkbM family methyltransferase